MKLFFHLNIDSFTENDGEMMQIYEKLIKKGEESQPFLHCCCCKNADYIKEGRAEEEEEENDEETRMRTVVNFGP